MRRVVLLALAVLALGACTGHDDGDDRDRPSVTARQQGEYVQPASCAGLDVKQGATLAGDALATCMDDALAAHGTGRQTLFAAQENAAVQARYVLGDEVGYESGGGAQDLVVVGDQAWMKVEDAWVEGDEEGDETQQAVAGLAASFQDGRFVINTEHVRQGGTWRVGAPERLELRDGDAVDEAWQVSVAKPYTLDDDTRVARHVVWLDRTLSPVKVQTDVTADGASVSGGTELYDLGREVTITAPR